jgi:hypothetical protein
MRNKVAIAKNDLVINVTMPPATGIRMRLCMLVLRFAGWISPFGIGLSVAAKPMTLTLVGSGRYSAEEVREVISQVNEVTTDGGLDPLGR